MDEVKNTKGFAAVGVAIIIFAMGMFGYAVYENNENNKKEIANQIEVQSMEKMQQALDEFDQCTKTNSDYKLKIVWSTLLQDYVFTCVPNEISK
jgi:hypothetical protein